MYVHIYKYTEDKEMEIFQCILIFELTTLVPIGSDCTGSCKSNYHKITTMMAPLYCYVAKCKIVRLYSFTKF